MPDAAGCSTTAVSTTTLRCAWVTIPFESVTRAVTVCEPVERTRANEVPVPICPSRFDIQTMVEPRSPSSVSLAAPEKLIEAPSEKDAPLDGVEIDTVGAVLGAAP